MTDPKEAYRILGIREGATRHEIEKRYDVLYKKFKAQGSTNVKSGQGEVSFDEIIAAYNLLMGYDVKEEEVAPPRKPSWLLQKLGLDQKKTENFIHYYKFHFLGGIILLIILVSLVKSIFFSTPIDLKVGFIGQILYAETETLEQNIAAEIPEIRGISIDGAIFYKGLDAEMEQAMVMKRMILTAAEEIDVYIVDREHFEEYASQGLFVSLDEIADELMIDKEANEKNILLIPEETAKHLYGIDVSKSSFLSGSNIAGEEMIAAIGIKGKHYDNAVKLMELLVR